MNKFKQEINVDANVTQMFSLPCVGIVFKLRDGSPMYQLNDQSDWPGQTAMIGDWLCEDHEGMWHLITKEEKRIEELSQSMVDEVKEGKDIETIVDKYVKTATPELRDQLIEGIKKIKEDRYENNDKQRCKCKHRRNEH